MEKTELEKLNPEELIKLSETNTLNFRYNRSDIYKVAFEKYKKSGEKEKREDMRKEILVIDLSTHSSPKKRFDSMMSGSTDKGEEWKYPDLEKDFPKEAVEYYKNRANVTTNPILRARYSDVIWELDKDVNYARVAVRAYLDCCPIYFTNEWDRELADSVGRALAIASTINDQSLIDASLKGHYELIKQMVEKRRLRYLFEIVESILSREKKVSDQMDHEYLISTIEDVIGDYAQNVTDSFHLQRSFMKLIEKSWQIRKNEQEIQKIKVRIAESFIEEAEWKKVNYPSGNSVAAHFYEEAMQAYMDLGQFPQKVEELKIKIQEANEAALKTDYQSISSEVKIPRKEIDGYLNMYKGRKTIEVFQIMSLDKNLIPSYEKSKKEATKQAKQFVLRHLVPVSVMKGNICVKQISEENEKLEYSTIENFQMGYRMIARILLNQIFLLLEEEHPNSLASLVQHLSSSGIIKEERLELLKHGFAAFEKKQYVPAIHILIFQIEAILRDLIGKLNLPTFSYRNNEMRERMLGDILTTLFKVPGIDKDFLKFIEIFLSDIRGDNYRNDVAHGLLTVKAFTKENAELLLLILIKLASYNVVKKGQTNVS